MKPVAAARLCITPAAILCAITKQLEERNIVFTTTPLNVQKYADFMYDIGLIKTRAGAWQELYFPEIYGQPGS